MTWKIISAPSKNPVQNMSFSTHTANLGLMFKVIPPERRPQVIMLGIQPGNMELGQGLTVSVRKTLDGLAELFMIFLNRSVDA